MTGPSFGIEVRLWNWFGPKFIKTYSTNVESKLWVWKKANIPEINVDKRNVGQLHPQFKALWDCRLPTDLPVRTVAKPKEAIGLALWTVVSLKDSDKSWSTYCIWTKLSWKHAMFSSSASANIDIWAPQVKMNDRGGKMQRAKGLQDSRREWTRTN